MEFYQKDVLSVSVNTKAKMNFEHLRRREEQNNVQNEENDNEDHVAPLEDPGAWEENFKGHHDVKPNGPSAIALDFTFHQANVLFGIPEHADTFALKTTVGNGDPYR